MDTQDNAFPVLKVCIHPFNLVRIHIGGSHLHRGREIDDNGLLLGGAPGLLYRCTDIKGKIQLCAGKALRGILQTNLGITVSHIPLYHLGAYDSYILYVLPVLMEHHIPL